MVPQAGINGTATIILMVVGAVLEKTGIKMNASNLVQRLPSCPMITRMVTQNAVNTIMLTKESIQHNPVVLISCNKGNQKGKKNLAKYLCWYCVKEKNLKTLLLDIDCADENSNDIAQAIKNSLIFFQITHH